MRVEWRKVGAAGIMEESVSGIIELGERVISVEEGLVCKKGEEGIVAMEGEDAEGSDVEGGEVLRCPAVSQEAGEEEVSMPVMVLGL
jgi:hypothetical protein